MSWSWIKTIKAKCFYNFNKFNFMRYKSRIILYNRRGKNKYLLNTFCISKTIILKSWHLIWVFQYAKEEGLYTKRNYDTIELYPLKLSLTQYFSWYWGIALKRRFEISFQIAENINIVRCFLVCKLCYFSVFPILKKALPDY